MADQFKRQTIGIITLVIVAGWRVPEIFPRPEMTDSASRSRDRRAGTLREIDLG